MLTLSQKLIGQFGRQAVIRPITTTAQIRDIFKINSQEEFDEKVRNSKKPVIVDFFATWVYHIFLLIIKMSYVIHNHVLMLFRWCNPCKMLTPRIESIIGENKGKVTLAKVIGIERMFFLFANLSPGISISILQSIQSDYYKE